MNSESGTAADRSTAGMRPTLPARDYYAAEVFELEKERIFFRNWFCVGREEQVPTASDFIVRDVVGESVLVVRDDGGRLRAFYNVCRHRGTRLCEGEGSAGKVLSCPYHAWTYSLDGRLIATPNVPEVAGFDRSHYGLHTVALEIWEGFIFLNLASDPGPLGRQLGEWTGYARYHLGRLRVAHPLAYEVAANWKIIHENYNECLHCPRVHPELVKVVPVYRRGAIVEPDGIWGNRLVDGATSFTRTGRSRLPLFPDLTEEELGRYNGMTIFPNLLLDCFPDNVLYTILWPSGPERTDVTCGLLVETSTIGRKDFDPDDVVEFHDLVNRQDWGICERAQRGQRSRAYRQGVYPPQDEYVYAFDQHYLRERER
jgi:phenylpropionate dioxygenase-like ring-hydroxylating dioxygenase large terminal subunit